MVRFFKKIHKIEFLNRKSNAHPSGGGRLVRQKKRDNGRRKRTEEGEKELEKEE